MEVGQPWMMVAGAGIAGLLMTAAASWWWSRRLRAARRLIDKLHASRDLLNQQNSQARRQIEQMHLEMTELRLLAERERRRVSNSGFNAALFADSAPPLPPPPPDLLLRETAAPTPRGFVPTQIDGSVEDEDGADDSGFAPTQIDRLPRR